MPAQVQKLTIFNEKIDPKDWAFLINSCSPHRLRSLRITGKTVMHCDARYPPPTTKRF